jgi:hypothetical protein
MAIDQLRAVPQNRCKEHVPQVRRLLDDLVLLQGLSNNCVEGRRAQDHVQIEAARPPRYVLMHCLYKRSCAA